MGAPRGLGTMGPPTAADTRLRLLTLFFTTRVLRSLITGLSSLQREPCSLLSARHIERGGTP